MSTKTKWFVSNDNGPDDYVDFECTIPDIDIGDITVGGRCIISFNREDGSAYFSVVLDDEHGEAYGHASDKVDRRLVKALQRKYNWKRRVA